MTETRTEPALVLDVICAASNAKFQAGEVVEGLRLAQLAVDASGGDPTKPSAILRVPAALALAFRGMNRLCLGLPGFREDLDEAVFRQDSSRNDLSKWWLRFVDTNVAKEKARVGDFGVATALARDAVDF